MKNLIGQQLNKRYQVLDLIGRGGMAEVYRVWDEVRADTLAMKVLREDLAQDKIFLRRFEREAQTLAKLQHRSIVRFFGLEHDDLITFLLLEFIDGSSLREEIFRAVQPFSIERVMEVLRPVCAAIHYAHQMGIVHCDLKPGNILINPYGEYLVTDFGIARMVDASTSTMVGIGTPAYMAPELIKGQDPSPQTDVYALGVILYEMLTGGERPFTGERADTTGSTAERIRWEQVRLLPKAVGEFNPDLPASVADIICKCMDKKPSNRYGDIQDVFKSIGRTVNSITLDGNNKKTESIFDTKVKKVFEVQNSSLQKQKRHRNSSADIQESIPITKKEASIFVWKQSISGGIKDFALCGDYLGCLKTSEVNFKSLVSDKYNQLFNLERPASEINFNPLDCSFFLRLNSGVIQHLDLKTGNLIDEISTTEYFINKFWVTEDGHYCLLTSQNEDILLWDLFQKELIRIKKNFYFDGSDMYLIPKLGKIIIPTQFKTAVLLSIPDLEIEKIFSQSKSGFIKCVSSRYGDTLAISDNSNGISVVDSRTLVEINYFLVGKEFKTFSFCYGIKYLFIICVDGTILIINVENGEILCNYDVGIEDVDKMSFAKGDQYLITLCRDKRLDVWKCDWGALS